jgi:hypothetical protein
MTRIFFFVASPMLTDQAKGIAFKVISAALFAVMQALISRRALPRRTGGVLPLGIRHHSGRAGLCLAR